MIDKRNWAGHNRAVSRYFTLARCSFGNTVAGPRARSIGPQPSTPLAERTEKMKKTFVDVLLELPVDTTLSTFLASHGLP
ncbi:hypothetical protein, partial [Klebsiella pneumoniae]|uniref:hypothetical protein n=1 Tax=Klebsiella pneumoniae TaxID=573 RepID=UPI003B985ACB